MRPSLALAAVSLVAAAAANGRAAQDASDTALAEASTGAAVRVRMSAPAPARVIELPVEIYVSRVLAGEGEPKADEAAHQSLAIAIRTYAAANRGRHRREGFDLCDTTHCQVLRPSTALTRRAALATAGRVLLYQDRPADVVYSASCGGRSEAASQVWRGALDHPYLRAADDDVHDGEAPWTLELTLGHVERVLRRAGFDGRRLADVRVVRRSESGRAARVHLAGMRPDEIAGEDFRAAIGARELRSTAFTVTRQGGTLRFTGRGYGHGVGLCVIGAGRRAARGESVAQILEQYFPGLRLGLLPSTAAAVRASERAAAPPGAAAPPHVGSETMRRAGSTLERIALRAAADLGIALGLPAVADLRVEMYDSLDDFRDATGRPWWISAAVTPGIIELPPVSVLSQRDGLEMTIRRAVAEMLISGALADRPAWVRVGAARHFARPAAQRAASDRRPRCPSDAELTMAVSAAAHRDAESRAEACFADALTRARGDWRAVR